MHLKHSLSCAIFAMCIFTPPDGWELAAPKKPNPYLQVAFVGPAQSNVRPLIQLAVEKIDVSLHEYIKSVRQLHESELHVEWRDLGPFTFRAGIGRLAEITSPTPAGDIKMLQAIFVKEDHAYIITASAPKALFSDLSSAMLSSIRSLRWEPNLFSCIEDPNQKKKLQDMLTNFDSSKDAKGQWDAFQKQIKTEFANFGLHWQFLILQEGHSRIFGSSSRQKPTSQ